MISPKKEFLKIKEIVESDNVKVKVVEKFKDSSVAGYAIFDDAPSGIDEIQIQKDKKTNYQEALMTLLHEYGHIVDRRRYGKSKRWIASDEWNGHDSCKIEKALEIPITAKRYILHTEFIAKENSKKLRKKFNIKCLSEETIEGNELLSILIRRYELLHGKYIPGRLRNLCKAGIIEGRINLSLKDILNFNKEILCLSMTLNA